MKNFIIVALVLGSFPRTATSSSLYTFLDSIRRESYTTNALCSKNNCINPVFPAMEDMHLLQQSKWVCSSLQKTSSYMGFCRAAITYDPAIPAPASGDASVEYLVRHQDDAAATMFYYHLNGLGKDAWDHQKPELADDCTKSIWRMVCYTYFPRAEIGCQDGSWSNYNRPCQSSCKNYIKSCEVECCDESVQCVFSHSKTIAQNKTVTTEGYLPHDGPSSLCTGGARRSAQPMGVLMLVLMLQALLFADTATITGGMRRLFRGGHRHFAVGVLVIMAMSLQGCDYDVPIHKVGNWRAAPDYLLKHEFVAPGAPVDSASLNSCAMGRLSSTLQCSGRGVCKLWNKDNLDNTLSFCKCDRDWADPECRTRRKSQVVAYMLSMFLGFLGADQFYLGFPAMGVLKLFTFGGFGGLWVHDIIEIGSAPGYAGTYRVAQDLPHFAFVLTATMYAMFIGFLATYVYVILVRSQKRKEAMTLQLDEESRQKDSMKPFADSYGTYKSKTADMNTKPIIASGPMNQNTMSMGPMGPAMASMGPMGGMGGMPPMGGPGYGSMGGPMGPMGPMGPPTMGGMGPMGPTPSNFM